MGEIAKFEASFSAELMKHVVKLKGTAADSRETMYLANQRFQTLPEDGKVVKVVVTISTASPE
jgi:hypothetical protein